MVGEEIQEDGQRGSKSKLRVDMQLGGIHSMCEVLGLISSPTKQNKTINGT